MTLTVSTDPQAAKTTLDAVRLIKEELGCHTSLGVSNVSFGLPSRPTVNSAFFTLALSRGLSAAIMNPHSDEMMSAYRSYCALTGLDEGCREYISYVKTKSQDVKNVKPDSTITLKDAVGRGLSALAAELTCELLKTKNALEIINGELIPALDNVGIGFEEKRVYLPELLMSAEAASAAFSEIRAAGVNGLTAKAEAKTTKILIATVEGDVHDIGKNIVKLLLENYGFEVHDLGKDVKPATILEKAKEYSVDIVGLSALMTTTTPAMEKTVRLLKSELPTVKIMVGGAVINEQYAESIGADYAKDAMSAVRYAEAVEKSIN